ncbi:hypothetical protein ACVWXU_000117 [Streptomyces sp. TE33382]
MRLELQVDEIVDLHFFQKAGPAAVVVEVGLLERFGGDLMEPAVAGALFLGLEETGGVSGWQGDRQVPGPVLVRGACPTAGSCRRDRRPQAMG